ncbi:hypothetical protein I546_2179 [Mycobacterium kansasii 732]|nr:hypothetical protein I546_2179 [Mycobacterium kansasii 732]
MTARAGVGSTTRQRGQQTRFIQRRQRGLFEPNSLIPN